MSESKSYRTTHEIHHPFMQDPFLSFETTLFSEVSSDEKHYVIQENVHYQDEPLIKFVDELIQQAIHHGVSDIHIEPYAKSCRIRYRRDGLLYQVKEMPSHIASRLTSRLKVMAKLDIAERRLPQDGRFEWRSIDIRMNTCPTQHGEKIVLRLLDINKISLDLNTLGLTEHQKTLLFQHISSPQGLILVTGPTGSGKSITLYSILNYLNTIEKNISTVEDPIEIQLHGINQVSLNSKINLDFTTILRTLLRQDPDILMVGEIRDKETADITIQAAETGHLVLSTLHTNSAIETINRFQSMGVSKSHFLNALTLIISQRLIRVLCLHCKQLDEKSLIYKAKGCYQCLNGYNGRTGLYEFFPITEKILELFLSDTTPPVIQAHAIHAGYETLHSQAMDKVRLGITSLDEVKRVLQT